MDNIIGETVDRYLAQTLMLFADHPEMQKLLRDMSLAVSMDLNGMDSTHNLFPKLLADEGVRLFEANFNAILKQVQTLDPGFKPACQAGCSYCCSSHITLLPQEAFSIGLYLAGNCNVDLFSKLAEQCFDIASVLENYSLEDFAADYFRPCPFLLDKKCSIYEVRPIVCRNWISTDIDACIASFNSKNTVTVPQNSLIMVQKDVIYAGQAAYLASFGINGRICSFIPLMAQVMTDFEGTYSKWLAGEKLIGQFELN